MDKLKARWGVNSNWDLVGIFLAFAVNGTFASRIVRPLLVSMGLNKENFHIALYYFLYIFGVFVVYQFTLPLSGWIFGQYKFFKNMQRKTVSRFGIKKRS